VSTKEGPPLGAIPSARTILYRPNNPLSVILRSQSGGGPDALRGMQRSDLKGRVVGGKLMFQECLFERAREEVAQEVGCSPEAIGPLRSVTTLFLKRREIEYPIAKWHELGFGLPEACQGVETVRLWNPMCVVFAAQFTGEVPTELVEDRRVFELALTPDTLSQVHRPHQTMMETWLKHHSEGVEFPPLIIVED